MNRHISKKLKAWASAEELADHEAATFIAKQFIGWSAAAIPDLKNLARAYLELAAQLRAQEGWVLVPREPTEAMIDAGRGNACRQEYGELSDWPWRNIYDDLDLNECRDAAIGVYRRMLSALPAAPGGKNG